MYHALFSLDFAPAPARGPPPSLARSAPRQAASATSPASRSSAPTLDEALASLDARRAASTTETALPPFQSALDSMSPRAGARTLDTRETHETHTKSAASLPRPPASHSVVAVIGVSPDVPVAPPSFRHQSGSGDFPHGAAASAAAAAAFAATPAMRFAAGAASLVFGGALSAFLIACVPTLRAIANAADEIADLAASIREEVPDTFAAVRVSGMELTDCLEEVGELTHDVSGGIKGTSKAIGYTVDTAEALGKYVGSNVKRVLPEVRRARESLADNPAVKRAIAAGSASVDETLRRSDETLRQNADTSEYSEPVVAAAARATKNGVRYARGAIRAAGVAKKVGQVVKTVRGVADAGAAEAARDDDESRRRARDARVD